MFGWKVSQEEVHKKWDHVGGENRNIKIVLLLNTIFNSTELDTITLKYLNKSKKVLNTQATVFYPTTEISVILRQI